MRNQAARMRFVGSFPGEVPELGAPEVAFAGRSNVGKSSMLNALLGTRKAARVSRTPGRTQAINLFQLGDALVFADLPGYGYAKVPEATRREWGPMIERYLAQRQDLRLVVVLVDARRDAVAMDGMLLYALVEADIPRLVVATKVDKLKKQQRQRQLAALRREFQLPADQPVPFSSVTGEGVAEVWARIERACA